MPELPEVEAARKALYQICCGRVIVEARVAQDPIVIHGVTPSLLQESLTGRTIVDARRKGKNLWLHLDHCPWPSFQFGMTGAFYIEGKEVTKYKRSAANDKEEWPSKFSKVFFKLDDGMEVSFTDKRRLARVRLLEDPASTPPISELGPDAFNELPDEAAFTSTVLKKKCSIKALLLDQSFLAGIGNWVADEVLYQARIHPEQVAANLSKADCTGLHKAIQEVINFAVEVDADSEKFPESWIFHNRWNKKGGEVDGKKIAFITVGGRTSAYVPAVQMCTTKSSRKENGIVKNEAGEDEVKRNTVNSTKKKGKKGSEKLPENNDKKLSKPAKSKNVPNQTKEEEVEDSAAENAKKNKCKIVSEKCMGKGADDKHEKSVESTKTPEKAENKDNVKVLTLVEKAKDRMERRSQSTDRSIMDETSTKKKPLEKQTAMKLSEVAEEDEAPKNPSRNVAKIKKESLGGKKGLSQKRRRAAK